MRYFAYAILRFSGVGLLMACTSNGTDNPTNGSGGGLGGSVGSGGAESGGALATGGTVAAMGGNATGASATGGASTTGGRLATGGALVGTGGATPGTGGASGGAATTTGGSATTSGGAAGSSTTATGGARATGGAASTGGAATTGGAPSTGGASSQVCAWDAGPSATNGGLTCYWFSQGTSKDEKTCPGGYKTYCGYCGGETGSMPQGSGQVWCPINDIANTVQNISTTHFVAIPPGPLAQGKNCGACVEVNYQGRSIVATVIDACPSCTSDQNIDLSLSAAKALGMTEQIGMVESGATWRIVGCPTTGNIAVSFNGGYQGQVYFQNLAFPIATASSGGQQATANTGFWDFGKVMGGQSVTLTDVMGHSVTATVPTSPGTLGVQFGQTCQ